MLSTYITTHLMLKRDKDAPKTTLLLLGEWCYTMVVLSLGTISAILNRLMRDGLSSMTKG